ncbi:cysteine synthase [Streptomyces syringium]|uniref:Cysteine synthase n=1 Tax=Streptomyces syringium TaxID=76729 RepID=A0ABS4YBV4_9ACTN|nr:cysteine synthase [Streptomyces syringium]
MDVHESVLDLVGGTPLVRLRTTGDAARSASAVYAKLEYLSVGGSSKDRIGLRMVEQAERDGLLRPGGTIVEATSGNTGIGLALVAARKGYRAVLVLSDRAGGEKVATLRAFGAEVVMRPGGLPREHPDHPVNTAARIAEETPGGWLAAQYDNPANPEAHYLTTGPKIWRQTEGRITHLVSCIGTGGTISGTGRYLKEVSGGTVQVVGADPMSSVYSGGDGRPYFNRSRRALPPCGNRRGPLAAVVPPGRRRPRPARRGPRSHPGRPPTGTRSGAARRRIVRHGTVRGPARGRRGRSGGPGRGDPPGLRAAVPLEVLRRCLAAAPGLPGR